MADNFTTQDALAATVTLASSDDGTAQAAKIVSFTKEPSATVTRPNDGNAYAAGDSITSATSSASAYTFSNCARVDAGCGTIMDATLTLSDPNATLSNFELWLFNANPAIPNDNAAFSFTDAEANTVEAVLKFYGGDYSDSSLNRIYHMANQPRFFKCASASKTLYGVLKTLTAFTPVAQSTFQINLKIIQDI